MKASKEKKAPHMARIAAIPLLSLALLAGCGWINLGGTGEGGDKLAQQEAAKLRGSTETNANQSTLADLFTNVDPPNTTIEVNKYIWNAAQQVLDFMPVEAVDPFSGVIVYGYGTPPGGRTAYRAVVYVQDPALDARSLNLSLNTRSGPASPDTVRAVEDAILTRARQLRIQDSKL